MGADRRLIAKHWDDVVDAIDGVLTKPPVDPGGRGRRGRARSRRLRRDEDEPVDDELERVESGADDDDAAEGRRRRLRRRQPVGAGRHRPHRIVTGNDEYLTLRCYLGDDPVFLGADGKVTVFTSPRVLSKFLADSNDHDLLDVTTFDRVRVRPPTAP